MSSSAELSRTLEVAQDLWAFETVFWGKPLYLYLFCGDRPLLCDAGPAGLPTELLLPALDRERLLPTGLAFLLNAHSHIDHYGGNGEFKARFPHLVILAHAREVELIADHQKEYDAIYDRWPSLFQFEPSFREEWLRLGGEETGPDIGLQNDTIIDIGGRRLQVVDLSGHSFGDLGLYDAERRILFSGEALLAQGARNDAGTVVAPPYYESAENYWCSLDVVQSLDVECLCTSHFGILKGEAVRTHVAESRRFFEEYERGILEILHAAGKQGLTVEAVAREYAARYSPFDFRLETMQAVSTHLDFLATKGMIRRRNGRAVAT
jgi:glyoxylase-like metal-dependent hydrolase (beta-lactamase superfamily II)